MLTNVRRNKALKLYNRVVVGNVRTSGNEATISGMIPSPFENGSFALICEESGNNREPRQQELLCCRSPNARITSSDENN